MSKGISKNPLVDEFELEGVWFLPGQSEDVGVSGRLFFSASDGIKLQLNGTVSDASFGDKKHEIILGWTSDGKPVTLVKSFVVQGKISMPGYAVESYRTAMAFIGKHYSASSEITFESLFVRYWNLEECVGKSGLTGGWGTAPGPFQIGWAAPSGYSATLGEFSLTTEFRANFDGDELTTRSITQNVFLKLASSEPKLHEEYLNGPCRTINSLLELAANERIPVLCVQGLPSSSAPDDDPIEILFQQRRGVPLPSRQGFRDLAFTFETLGERFAECVARWHSARANYGPTFDHYFSLNRTEMPLEHRFLSLSQALESYHRRAFPSALEEPKPQHTERLQRLLSAIHDADDKKWLKQKLAFANELSFKKRFEALYDLMPDQLKAAIGTRESFARAIAETRHYLTHYNPSRKDTALQGAQLATAVHQLSAILRMVFLIELGVNVDVVLKSPWGQRLLYTTTAR